MDVLNLTHIEDVLRHLRTHLEPVERTEQVLTTLTDAHTNARKAAVLLPLFVQGGSLCLAFIRRASSLRSHAGEIAFPGGKLDPGDLFPTGTALRETQEEIGLDPQQVEILGILTPVFTVVSNYIITPVVAFLPHGLGPLHLQTSEVTELIIAPLQALADPAIAHTEQWLRDNQPRTVYFYEYGPYHIWGATGRILASLLDILTS